MRYPLEAAAFFRWKDEDGSQRKGEGISRDLSEAGAFVLAAVCPPVGANVALKISVVSQPAGSTPLRMDLEGRVLRVEQATTSKGSSGFAVATNEATLRENDEGAGEESASADRAL